jgi:hypothetical protein
MIGTDKAIAAIILSVLKIRGVGRETVGAMRGTWWQWLIVVLIFAMFTLTLAAGLYVRLAGCDGARPTAPRTRGSDGESSAHA